MDSDLTFITNEKDRNLLERFKVLIKDTQFFDVLVGYFFTSGFHALYKSLEKTKKIRILIGISTDKQIVDLAQESKNLKQGALEFSSAEIKEQFSKETVEEMSGSQDSQQVDEGVAKFLEWLKKGKLEIKAYPTSNIHAKLYIMTFAKSINR
jgi:HKD family nuclease